jgi:hypothetical protein
VLLFIIIRTDYHRLAELFMAPMIGTGAERDKFAEIVERVGDSYVLLSKPLSERRSEVCNKRNVTYDSQYVLLIFILNIHGTFLLIHIRSLHV